MKSQPAVRRIEPLANDWCNYSWDTGAFDTARRNYTSYVEGVIMTPQHIVMVTMTGGASRLEVTSDCGHRFEGTDHAGAVSFVPAHCERRLRMRGVESAWASIALSPTMFALDRLSDDSHGSLQLYAFSNVTDQLVVAMMSEFLSLSATHGRLDATYCDAMSWALAQHLLLRYGQVRRRTERKLKLPSWRLRRIADYVDAHIAQPISIEELAAVAELSAGHFHRAFRQSSGQTPLAFIVQRRIERAKELLRYDEAPIADIALRVGFVSPSHFARAFRQITGTNPAAFRKLMRSTTDRSAHD